MSAARIGKCKTRFGPAERLVRHDWKLPEPGQAGHARKARRPDRLFHKIGAGIGKHGKFTLRGGLAPCLIDIDPDARSVAERLFDGRDMRDVGVECPLAGRGEQFQVWTTKSLRACPVSWGR